MNPAFTLSINPARSSRSGSVPSTPISANTARGCKKFPTRFFPSGRFTPTLPPTLESTCAKNVVGTCT